LCEEENITNCSINLKIMDDMEMQKLNKDFRSINKPTNVLSFANEDISKEHTGNLGDIAINSDYVTRESNEQNKQYDDHMIHMLIHGVYHILGYDHEQNEEAYNMELKEVNLLKKLDIKNPYK
jgi:probable rRNA maturation factor